MNIMHHAFVCCLKHHQLMLIDTDNRLLLCVQWLSQLCKLCSVRFNKTTALLPATHQIKYDVLQCNRQANHNIYVLSAQSPKPAVLCGILRVTAQYEFSEEATESTKVSVVLSLMLSTVKNSWSLAV